jgi:hypothetical protein
MSITRGGLRVYRAPAARPCWNCRATVPKGGALWCYPRFGERWVCTQCAPLLIMADLTSEGRRTAPPTVQKRDTVAD